MARVNFNEIYSRFITQVYEDDMESQNYYLSVIETQRYIPVSYLIERGCAFIPNNDYIRHFLGDDVNHFGLELYNGDRCLWTLYVVIPITDLTGDIVGLVGWDVLHKYQEQTEGRTDLSMYKVSSKNVFKKEHFFLSDVQVLRKTFDSRVIFITDGVFDSIALNYRGIPAIALLGSTFSPEVLYFLHWYKRVYVCSDNDAAGVKLYNMLKRSLNGVYRVIQNKTKDIEELLRTDGPDGPITQQLRSIMKSGISGDVILR